MNCVRVIGGIDGERQEVKHCSGESLDRVPFLWMFSIACGQSQGAPRGAHFGCFTAGRVCEIFL